MDANALKARIVLKGYKVDEFIDLVNEKGTKMSRSAYYKGLSGEHEYGRSQIQAISETLELDDEEIIDIFFKWKVS